MLGSGPCGSGPVAGVDCPCCGYSGGGVRLCGSAECDGGIGDEGRGGEVGEGDCYVAVLDEVLGVALVGWPVG